MRVLHVIPSVAAGDGGPSVAVRAMARGLAARGLEVSVATTTAGMSLGSKPPLRVPLFEDGAEYRYFPCSLPGKWKFSWSLTRWLYRHAGEYDVVHVHALFSYSTIPGCRAAISAGVPYVLRPLGTLDSWSLQQRAWKKRPYFSLIERHHLRHAAAIHTTSPMESEAVAKLGYAEPVRMVPLGVDVPLESTSSRRDAGGPLEILFLSRLHPKKGLPLLFEAVARLLARGRQVNLTVAGSGPTAYQEELEALCRGLGIARNVRFVGAVDGERKKQVLSGADLFVLPSYQENFGIAVAEAMAVGIPVIVSDQVGICDEIDSGGAGVVVPCDGEALANAILDMASDPSRRKRMGENSARLVRDRFSWQHTCELLMDLYQEILSRTPHRNGIRTHDSSR